MGCDLHRAKAAVSAREAGADIPPHAQGKAASAIARGIDPASLFTAMVDPGDTGETDGGDPVDTGDGVVPVDDGAVDDVVDDAVDEPDAGTGAVTDGGTIDGAVMSAEDIALALLDEAAGEET